MSSWSEYLEEIRCLARSYADRRWPPLFRGHANCKWSLKTTLERYYEDEKIPSDPSFLSYYKRASRSPKSAVETLILESGMNRSGRSNAKDLEATTEALGTA